jgi:hypothetical protein
LATIFKYYLFKYYDILKIWRLEKLVENNHETDSTMSKCSRLRFPDTKIYAVSHLDKIPPTSPLLMIAFQLPTTHRNSTIQE